MITLGIIGVVAALTMPALIAKHQEKVTVTKLKKVYSQLSQAYLMAQQEYGDPTGWDLIAESSPAGENNLIDKFVPYLKIISRIAEQDKKIINSPGDNIILADGAVFRAYVRSAACKDNRGDTETLSNVCGGFFVDINGSQAPNKNGQDVFYFLLSKDAVIPCGTQDERTRSFDGNCKLKADLGCTAWVIYNENMDYLHCDDLSWGGKTRCN